MDAVQELSPEHRKLIHLALRLARECFGPRAARYHATATFPFENHTDLRRHGLLGLMMPREHEGLGADSLTTSFRR